MLLFRALRIQPHDVVALAGGGGKTTLMFRLADELAAAGRRVVTTMTTKIFVGQMALVPGRLVLQGEGALLAQLPQALAEHGHVLVAGGTVIEQDKVQGVSSELVDRIAAQSYVDAVIIEADGSRRLPFKAPAPHEPVIPASTTVAVPVVGLDVVGRPLTADHVHRPQLVAELTGAALGDPVTPAMIAAVLAHPQGGARNVPPAARLIPFLNKVEDERTLTAAREIARLLLTSPRVDSVLIGAARAADPVREVWSRVGAVLLAAGEAKRFGSLKQVMPWRGVPLVAHVAEQALRCPAIDRVVVTVGAGAERVAAALDPKGFRKPLGSAPLLIVHVPDWAAGQSRSVQAGLAVIVAGPIPPSPPPLPGKGGANLPSPRRGGAGGEVSAVIFLLVDQPGVSPELLSALVQRHRETLAPVVAPRYQGRRGNPVLFDCATFGEFAHLAGDIGARPIIQAHRDEIAWVDWPTSEILQDLDTEGDYRERLGAPEFQEGSLGAPGEPGSGRAADS
ncbi:MAG: selenium cofactor biosynthesis protein YqeC [Chloroflexi bacterium]|nr:selenium cofactor biosynthesis protein YqeC [Chloroflexota bacterium]